MKTQGIAREHPGHGGVLETIKERFKAHAYSTTTNTIDWTKLFPHERRTGFISYQAFRTAVRKEAKITPDTMNDAQLEALWKHVDKDGSGTLDYESEFIPWVDPDGLSLKEPVEYFDHGVIVQEAIGLLEDENRGATPVKRKQANAEKKFKKQVALVRQRLRFAALYNGRVQWKKLFRHYCKRKSGQINFDEFRTVVRKDAKVGADLVSEHILRKLFNHIDSHGQGYIDCSHFITWARNRDSEAEEAGSLGRLQEDAQQRELKCQKTLLLTQVNQAFARARVCLPFNLKWANGILNLTDPKDRLRRPMTTKTVHEDLKDGSHLLHLIRALCPAADFGSGLYTHPKTRPMCIFNISEALSAAGRYGGLHVGAICSPDVIYDGHILHISRILMEFFTTLQMRPMRVKLKMVFREMDAILSPMGRPLLEQTLQTPAISGHHVLTDFSDGTRIMALLVWSGRVEPREMAKMYGNPENQEQIESNAKILNDTLLAKKLPVYLEAKEWSCPPAWNFDCLFLQLCNIWTEVREDCQGQSKQPDLSNFRFKDNATLRLSSNDKRSQVDKAIGAAKRAEEADVGNNTPSASLSRRFENFVARIGGLEVLWQMLDPNEAGSVYEKEFCHILHLLNCKLNWRRIFTAADERNDGHITKDELQRFCDASNVRGNQIAEIEDQIMSLGQNFPQQQHWAKKALGKRRADVSNDVHEFVQLIEGLGGVEAAYEHFNPHGFGRVTASEFTKACDRLNFVGNTRHVFHQMDLDWTGVVEMQEFHELVKAVRARGSKTEKDNLEMEVLIAAPTEAGDAWPNPKLTQLDTGDRYYRLADRYYFGELRMASAAEERHSLFMEDQRRQREIAISGAISTAQRFAAAADEASAAVYEAPSETLAGIPDSLANQIADTACNPQGVAAVGPAPTTSLDARVVLTDRSEVPMWLQTAVVDRTGRGSVDIKDAVFVLEVRDQRKVNSLLHMQLDLSKIISVEQLGTNNMDDPSANLSFVIVALSEADLEGSVVNNLEDIAPVGHPGENGVTTLYVVVGASQWKRREALRFFDELRIMIHLLSEGSPTEAVPQVADSSTVEESPSASPRSPESPSASLATQRSKWKD